jgi:hypothetical protein
VTLQQGGNLRKIESECVCVRERKKREKGREKEREKERENERAVLGMELLHNPESV